MLAWMLLDIFPDWSVCLVCSAVDTTLQPEETSTLICEIKERPVLLEAIGGGVRIGGLDTGIS